MLFRSSILLKNSEFGAKLLIAESLRSLHHTPHTTPHLLAIHLHPGAALHLGLVLVHPLGRVVRAHAPVPHALGTVYAPKWIENTFPVGM